MKMPEKRDLLAAILAAKEQGIEAITLRLQWRTFAADIMAVRLQKQKVMTQRWLYCRLVHS